MTNLHTFLKNEIAELFGNTFEETCDTQMCRDTPFENHCLKMMSFVDFIRQPYKQSIALEDL